MAWKKGKLQKSKRPYQRWSKNPQKVNNAAALLQNKPGETGSTVLYRHHAKSLAFDKVDTTDQSKQTYLGLPLNIISILQKYDGKKDEDIPPVIRSMSLRRKMWQNEFRQGFTNVHCIKILDSENDEVMAFLEGTRGYYVWYNKSRQYLKQSIIYTSERMRQHWKLFDTDLTWNFTEQLRWVDIVIL